MNEQIRDAIQQGIETIRMLISEEYAKACENNDEANHIVKASDTLKLLKAAHARYAGSGSEVKGPSVSWGIDWGRDGDQSCASIVKHYSDGRKEVVAVEYSPAQPKVPDGMVQVRIDDLRKALGVSQIPPWSSSYKDHPEALKRLAQAAKDALSAQENNSPAPAVPTDYALVPLKPSTAQLDSIAMRLNQYFRLMNEHAKNNVRMQAMQVYEEVTGQGFHNPNKVAEDKKE